LLKSIFYYIDHMLPTHWPEVMVFRDLFVYCLDIFGVPRRSFFEMLAYFTTNDDHTERLREFAAPEGQVCCFIQLNTCTQTVYL
jgi:sulfite reductase alpha subunit-like flavoprotein